MKFIQHYSSSRSNLYEVVGGGSSPRRLLLECGVRWPTLQEAIRYDLTNIDGCLLTHEHMDHAMSAKQVMCAGIDLYASAGTLRALDLQGNHRQYETCSGDIIRLQGYWIYPFDIEHDAQEPLGYLIREMDAEDTLLFCPDSAYLKQKFSLKFTIIALEVNYNKEILNRRVKDGDINAEVAKRIVANHAEVNTTLSYLRKHCDLSRCRQIHLLHCSGANLNKRKTKKLFEDKLFIETVVA